MPNEPTSGQGAQTPSTPAIPTPAKAPNPFQSSPPEPPAGATSAGAVPPTGDSRSHGGAVAPLNAPPAVPGSERAGGSADTVPPSQPSGDAPPAGGTPPPPAAAPTALTPETLKTIVEAAVRGTIPNQPVQGQPPRAMSQEEFNAHYGLPTVDAATYEAILGTGPDKPERAQALQTLLHQSAQASLKMAADLQRAEIAKLNERLAPLFNAHQAQREQAIAGRFFQSYPEFKGDEALITEIKDAFIARKANFASEKEAFDAVAAQARQILAKFRPSQGAAPAQPAGGQRNNGGSTNPPARTMTPSLQGGRGGTGAATQKPIAEQIFGS